MPFVYHRTVHFADTDAAGVVFFANYLAICHEAYEEALGAAGIELKTFFAAHAIIIPIGKSEAEYLRPLAAGDKLRISGKATSLGESTFEIRFELFRLGPPEKLAARIRTEHICIETKSRQRRALPPALATWLAHSGA
jgi:1,4-dihydroxy-2-naphthoyl-CoA hydrolase